MAKNMNVKENTMDDTIKLLRECDAGLKMAQDSIDEVLDVIEDEKLKHELIDAKNEHFQLKKRVQNLLNQNHDDGKEPPMMAKGMSWLKMNMKITMHESDQTIAELISDGCHMGIKSLYRYLNQYQQASHEVKEITKQIIHLEEKMMKQLNQYL